MVAAVDQPSSDYAGLDGLWPHDLMRWAAQLDTAVTHGFELASIERIHDPAGAVLLDQLAGLPCGTGDDVRHCWPELATVVDRDDPVFVQVVACVVNRVSVLRTTAYEMAAAYTAEPVPLSVDDEAVA